MIDVFTRYAWIRPLKDKKGTPVINAFIEIVNESRRKTNKLWVYQGKESYNGFMLIWLGDNILMYSTNNEGKSVIAERFIKTFKV